LIKRIKVLSVILKKTSLKLINLFDFFEDFKDFLKAIAYWKILEAEKEESDLVDAFVAMGGNPDKTGTVDARSLIRTVKNEFEMTIDIEVCL